LTARLRIVPNAHHRPDHRRHELLAADPAAVLLAELVVRYRLADIAGDVEE
jgi:hypothetical protein